MLNLKIESEKKVLSAPKDSSTLAIDEDLEAKASRSSNKVKRSKRKLSSSASRHSTSRSRSRSSQGSRTEQKRLRSQSHSRSLRSRSASPLKKKLRRSRSLSKGSRHGRRISGRRSSHSRSSSARSWRKSSRKTYHHQGSRSRSRSERSRSTSRRRSRSWSQPPRRYSRSRSPPTSYQPTTGGPQQHYHQPNSRYYNNGPPSSTWSSNQKRQQWIPVTPCTATETVEIDKLGTILVRIAAKGEFSFKDNAGAMVRVTKWTGRDSVPHIHIRPQVVMLDENSSCEIEVYNPLPSKRVTVAKYDKVACISVLSCPPSSEMYDAMDMSPEQMADAPRRWFKVSAVVLHRKGTILLTQRGSLEHKDKGFEPCSCCCVCDYNIFNYLPPFFFCDYYLMMILDVYRMRRHYIKIKERISASSLQITRLVNYLFSEVYCSHLLAL